MKSLACHSPAKWIFLCIESSVCVFVRFEGAGVMRRFLWCTEENIYLLTCDGAESHGNANGLLADL